MKKKKVTKNNNAYLFTKIKLTNKDLRNGDIELLIYDKNDKKFYPGVNNIKLFSIPSARLIQFPIIFIS